MKMLTARRDRLVTAAMGLAVLLCGAAGDVSAQEVGFATLAAPAADFALDPQTGNLAAVEPENNRVVLYGGDFAPGTSVKPIARVDVFNEPAVIYYKRTPEGGVFVVSGRGDGTLYVLEPATLKITAKIPVGAKSLDRIWTSTSPDDPHIYFSGPPLRRVDIRTKRVSGNLNAQGVKYGAVSARGSFFYASRFVGMGSPAGIGSLSILEAKDGSSDPKLTQLVDQAENCSGYVPDPLEQYCYVYKAVYTADLTTKVRDLEFQPLAFFADRAIMAGVVYDRYDSDKPWASTRRIKVMSYNTHQELGSKKVSEGFVAPYPRDADQGSNLGMFSYNRRRIRLLADDGRKRIVLAYGDHAATVPLEELTKSDERYLAVEANTKTPLVIGRKSTIPLMKHDPQATVELVDWPPGLTLSEAGLEWTPGEAALGRHKLVLRLKKGDLKRELSLELTVERPAVPLPMAADRFAVAGDGRLAFIWTTPAGDDIGRPLSSEKAARGAVIDLESGKTIVERPLPAAGRAGTIDRHFAYIAAHDSNTVHVLDRAKLATQKQLTLPGKVDWLASTEDKGLVVGLADGRRVKYSVPDVASQDWVVTEQGGANLDPFGRRPNDLPEAHPVLTPYGWRTGSGDRYDTAFSKLTLLVEPRGIRLSARVESHESLKPMLKRPSEFPARPRDPSLGRGDASSLAVWSDERRGILAVLSRYNLITRVPTGTHLWSKEEKWSLDLIDPVGRTYPAQRSIVLSQTHTPSGPDRDFAHPPAALAAAGEWLFVFTPSHYYRLPIAELASGTDLTLHFEPRQSALTIEATKSTILKHVAAGGKPPYQFAIAQTTNGISVDPATGELTIDGPAIAAAALGAYFGTADHPPRPGRKGLDGAALDAIVKESAATFREVAGRDATGVPMQLTISITATDAEKQTAGLTYCVLMELPRAAVEERIAQVAAAAAANGGENGDAETEIRRLEQRLIALEAQLELLGRLLERRKNP